MKKSILLIPAFVIVCAGCADSLSDTMEAPEETTTTYGFSDNDIVQGRLRIKLKAEPADGVAVRSSGGIIETGVRALDDLANELGIKHMERTFPHAGKYEERTRREGLHLWYNVLFSEEIAATRAVNNVSAIADIEIAAPVLKVVSTAAPTRSVTYPFNDPQLSLQWGYHNPGTESWQVEGADICLLDVWGQYNGHPDIIVAIMDGGIASDNPDLQANLWINEGEIAGNGLDDDGNGYADDVNGYNFVSMTSTITPHRHGTHVAGTIGAVNNNGIGVGGIAGGNGTPNSGVKLMSCQIFEHPSGNIYADVVSVNIPAAIKYGADNGAVISQNSWGYAAGETATAGARSSYVDQADKEAIDYFIKYAGCDNNGDQLPGSPMKGGIVMFASGNANTSVPRTAAPADYEKVLGVAAIGPDYIKGDYSNYGDYMDICAPGGTKVHGIYSTTVKDLNYYEYRYGTSMSCPHVAGVAALVIQKYGVGKPGFTASRLEDILLLTAYDVDSYNPDYAGLLGLGCVDATAALSSDDLDEWQFKLMSGIITDGILAFRVRSGIFGEAVLSIINGTGNTVMRKNLTTQRYDLHQVDISALAAGYYTLRYECNGTKVEEKFIKY